VTEYFAARNVGGTLLVVALLPNGTFRNMSPSSRMASNIQVGLVAWQTGPIDHVAVPRLDGTLSVFYATTGTTSWRVVDVTRITDQRVQGASSAYQLRDGTENVEILGSRDTDGKLLLHWWKPSRDWQSVNLSEITGHDVSAPPAGWLTKDGDRVVEHLAAAGTGQQLLVFSDFATPRRLTDGLGSAFQSVKRTRNVVRKVVTILWDPANPDHPAPDRSKVEAKLFGATNSVKGYYLENSNNTFTIANAGVFGWYRADKNWEHYWNDNPGPGRSWDHHHKKYRDGWLNGHYEKWTEAIRKADPEFDFAAYDTNGDKVLGTDELGILIVIPQNNPFGVNRPPAARQAISIPGNTFPVNDPLVVDGVRIPMIAEWYTGNSGHPDYDVNLGTPAHELAHLLLGLPDMYFHYRNAFTNPFAAGDYSLMDRSYQKTHLDPFMKLKLGWLRPKILFRGGSYDLDDVESRHTAWILMDPARGSDEYFIVENRFRGNSEYDVEINDQGLAVWHIMENPAVYGALPPPPGVTAAQWAQVGTGDWGRRAIRMLRSIPLPFNDGKALYDGADSLTGYDLLSDDSDARHSELRWADGSPSGFALRNISAAGATMQADVTVP
jgi:M6 family metalloprotease-like protein